MDCRTPPPQTPAPGDHPTDPGPDPQPCPPPPPQEGTLVDLGAALVKTIRHFFPLFNDWLDRLPDARNQDAIVYDRRFLVWWGIALYLFQLSSRRQLDFDLEASETHVLGNLNRLAQTEQTTRPVHDTLDYFLGGLTPPPLAALRSDMVRRLMRSKALERARLLGHWVVPVDGTGVLCFHRRHCAHCLVQKHGDTTVYLHPVLEAKLLGPAGVVLSIGTECIQNEDAGPVQTKNAEEIKQDCELKALDRLAPQIKQAFPQAHLVLSGDSLFACGRVLQICKDNHWNFVLVFKPGRMPALFQEYESLLSMCPRNCLERKDEDGTERVYRWVHELWYEDSDKRRWTLNALECVETSADGVTKRFVWLTRLPVSAKNVEAIAWKGGRYRWKEENEGFNRQKNSGLNLEHVYSIDPEKWKAYYYLLQIAFIIIQLLERGSLLRQMAEQRGKTSAVHLFGSLKNIAHRLLESIRNRIWPAESYDAAAAARMHISLVDTS